MGNANFFAQYPSDHAAELWDAELSRENFSGPYLRLMKAVGSFVPLRWKRTQSPAPFNLRVLYDYHSESSPLHGNRATTPPD